MQEQAGLPFRHREMRGTTGLCRILLGSPRHLGYNPREASLLESAFPVFLLLLSYLTVKWTFLAGGGGFGSVHSCTARSGPRAAPSPAGMLGGPHLSQVREGGCDSTVRREAARDPEDVRHAGGSQGGLREQAVGVSALGGCERQRGPVVKRVGTWGPWDLLRQGSGVGNRGASVVWPEPCTRLGRPGLTFSLPQTDRPVCHPRDMRDSRACRERVQLAADIGGTKGVYICWP